VVFIATPIKTHFEVAKKCLEQGKNVFLEKPMATRKKECEILIDLADRNGLSLYTDYLEMTAPSRLKMVELLPEIGKIETVLGRTIQKSNLYNIDWQLTCHQISMLSLFVNLDNIKLSKMKSIETVRFIIIDGKLRGEIFIYIDCEDRYKSFKLWGKRGYLEYDKSFGVECNGERYYFDENNNIDYSIQKFIKILHGEPSNSEVAMQITEIIENGLSSM
jgi:hypothetical protein